MESVKLQMTKENIKFVKSISSFSKVVNSLLDMARDDKELYNNLIKHLSKRENR